MTTTDTTRVMTRDEASSAMTTWVNEALWVPLVEGDGGDITGPGHQDRTAFASDARKYDLAATNVALPLTAADVKHRWVIVYINVHDDEWTCVEVPEGTPGAIPVTTAWGVR